MIDWDLPDCPDDISFDTDDFFCTSPLSAESSADSGGWHTMDVKLFAGAQDWLAQLLHCDDQIPQNSRGPRVDTHPGGPEFPESAVVRFDTGNVNFGTGRGQLDLPLGTLPVTVAVNTDHVLRLFTEDDLREAHAKATPMHPRIMGPLGFGVSPSCVVGVLPDLGGAGLRMHLWNHPNADKRRLIIQVAEGLEYLHYQAYIVHGFLEPDSVHVSDFGDVVLDNPAIIPGVSIKPYIALPDAPPTYRHVSNQQRFEYQAPEIVLGDADHRYGRRDSRLKTRESDMYAFGMLVYVILSGREPWADAKLADIFRYLVSGRLLPRPEDGTIDDVMWSLCTACWSPNPSDRPGISNVLAGLRSEYPPTRWRPDAAVQGDRWLHAERPSVERHATPTALDVEIGGTMVNIVFQKQDAVAGGFSTVMKGYSYQEGVIEAYAAKICVGKSVMPREYEIWRSLQHRNILRLLGIIDTNLPGARELIFITPYLENGNLTNYLGSSPNANRLDLMIGVAEGLAYLHDIKGIVHGDIKAENILIDEYGRAVLADFGFSTYVAPGAEETLLELRQAYTLTYCAPEVLDDTAEDPSHPGVIRSKTRMSDIYAYGVLLYQTYAGGLGESRRARMRLMLDMHDGHFPPRPVGHNPILCDDLWSICKRCWSRDPLQRPTIATVRAELEELHMSSWRQTIETLES